MKCQRQEVDFHRISENFQARKNCCVACTYGFPSLRDCASAPITRRISLSIASHLQKGGGNWNLLSRCFSAGHITVHHLTITTFASSMRTSLLHLQVTMKEEAK